MERKYIQHILMTFFFLTTLCLSGCSTSNAPADTETTAYKSAAPQRVDIRGSIIMRRYDQNQVMLEVDSFAPSPDSRYNRAYVLVLPTTQIIGPDGRTISLSELQQGQNVAILLRGGGRGNQVGLGVARKMWIEEIF